jgi:hypothetical protein
VQQRSGGARVGETSVVSRKYLYTAHAVILSVSEESRGRYLAAVVLINIKIAPRRSFTSAAFVQDDSKQIMFLSYATYNETLH